MKHLRQGPEFQPRRQDRLAGGAQDLTNWECDGGIWWEYEKRLFTMGFFWWGYDGNMVEIHESVVKSLWNLTNAFPLSLTQRLGGWRWLGYPPWQDTWGAVGWWLRCQVSSLMGGWKLGFNMHGDVWRGKKHSISWVTRQHQCMRVGKPNSKQSHQSPKITTIGGINHPQMVSSYWVAHINRFRKDCLLPKLRPTFNDFPLHRLKRQTSKMPRSVLSRRDRTAASAMTLTCWFLFVDTKWIRCVWKTQEPDSCPEKRIICQCRWFQ